MNEIEKKELADLIQASVIAALESRPGSCCATVCIERCGLTPVMHASDHLYVYKLRTASEQVGKTARKAGIVLIASSMFTFLGWAIIQWIKSVAGQ